MSLLAGKGLATQERIKPALNTNGGIGAVAGANHGVIRQRHKLGTDALYLLVVAGAGEISSTDTEVKERISAEHYSFLQQADTARCMARRMKYPKMQVANVDSIAFLKQAVRWGRRRRKRV